MLCFRRVSLLIYLLSFGVGIYAQDVDYDHWDEIVRKIEFINSKFEHSKVMVAKISPDEKALLLALTDTQLKEHLLEIEGMLAEQNAKVAAQHEEVNRRAKYKEEVLYPMVWSAKTKQERYQIILDNAYYFGRDEINEAKAFFEKQTKGVN